MRSGWDGRRCSSPAPRPSANWDGGRARSMELCGAPRSGFWRTAMPHKPVAIVTAMRMELAPLLRGKRAQQVDGVELFEIESAMVALSGIGKNAARRAAEAVIRYAQPELLVSAGIAGAASPKLKVGDVGWAREVVDAETGERYPTRCGEWVVTSVRAVSSPEDKIQLRERYGADVV